MAHACCQAASIQVEFARRNVLQDGRAPGSESSSMDGSSVMLSQFLGRSKYLRSQLSKGRNILLVRYPKSVRASFAGAGNTWSSSANGGPKPSGRYERIGDCLVFPPLPKYREPKGIIKFLGGAFIGASPDVTYGYFIELLAKEGYLIVATPYNVTFDHEQSALRIHEKFNNTLRTVRSSGFSMAGLSTQAASKLPVYSVGHSNGALMQVLIGSLCSDGQLPKANAIISFNNKPAADAVPFFDQMGPAMQQAAPMLQSSPFTSVAASFAAEAMKLARDVSIPLPPGVGQDDLKSVQNFFEQIPGVLNQVTEGVSEFRPTPAENRRTIAAQYSVPNNLLVKFTDDTIDETDLVEEPLMARSYYLGGTFKKVVITGTHATPLAQDLRWQVGGVYSPVDAVAQVVKYAALADLRTLVRNVVDFFDTVS
ncbi:hypothetical protein R1sor_000988 [Riccia sorocarpa]|uniref:DUF1350 domain-containing protein n=1 Tax=Riccia sorocarpa TaxID=122646 RepID=A0ABD3GWN1_9MARC